MLLIIVCAVLLGTALVMMVVWWRARFIDPEPPDFARRPALAGIRYFAWWAGVFTITGTVSGVLVVGAGGRLAMRVLALTSPDARGRLTEGGELVGEITLGGTLALLVFAALPLAFASTVLYLIAAPWLPRGGPGGALFGVVLLVTGGTTIEPLRAGNIDFLIVGPAWLALLLFAALAVLQGAFLAALAGRLSRSLPMMTRRNWLGTATPFVAGILYPPLGVVLLFGTAAAAIFPRILPTVARARSSTDGVILGRALLVGAVLVALPQFVIAVVSIASRG